MKHFVYTIALAVFFSVSLSAVGQSDTAHKENKIEFKVGVFYNSGLNYYGRTDSLQSQGVFPLAEIWFNKIFYVNAAPVFVMNNANPFEYAGTVTTIGARFGKPNDWSGNIYLVKPLYHENSQLVQSALKAQLAGTYTKLGKVINLTVGGDIKLSDKLDYGATAGVDHPFRFEMPGEFILLLDPSAYIHAGTQQFTSTSYKQSGFLLFPGIREQVTEQVSKFNILSYEVSMPIVLAKGKFQFITNPAFVLPQNLIIVPGRSNLSERGRNMFYVTTGLRLSL